MNKILEKFNSQIQPTISGHRSHNDAVLELLTAYLLTGSIAFATTDVGREDTVVLIVAGSNEQLMPILAEVTARQDAQIAEAKKNQGVEQ